MPGRRGSFAQIFGGSRNKSDGMSLTRKGLSAHRNTETAESFSYTYANDGIYNVELIATDGCDSDTVTQQVIISTAGINENQLAFEILQFQNKYKLLFNYVAPRHFQLYDAKGSLIQENKKTNSEINIALPESGMYILHVAESNKSAVIKLFSD